MSFRSTISRARLEHIRRAKTPTQAETEQAMREHPDNPFHAAQRALELASVRLQQQSTPFRDVS